MERKNAKISVIESIQGFFYLFFGRIPFQIVGLVIFSIAALTLISFNNRLDPIYYPSFSRITTQDLPIAIKTTNSPLSTSLSTTDILEEQGLVNTPKGIFTFSKKLHMFSTSYDQSCHGCNGVTASGLPTGYGVVAVDPKVIPLGTKLFVPGYGFATAGDTGGAIKGHKIDLGFDDLKTGWWSARFTDVYILN